MRSVKRGPWPVGNNGQRILFANYRNAKKFLFKRLGEYCSYCERPDYLQVEHVVPQSEDNSNSNLKTEWSNFLLGCINCNSRKSDRNKSRGGYLWPDRDDTFIAFDYRSGGRVSVSSSLSEDDNRKASALFDLVRLGAKERVSDSRRHKRRRIWDLAVEFRNGIKGNNKSRHLAVTTALETGFFSVWIAVFHDDADMCRRLVGAFPGTRET